MNYVTSTYAANHEVAEHVSLRLNKFGTLGGQGKIQITLPNTKDADLDVKDQKWKPALNFSNFASGPDDVINSSSFKCTLNGESSVPQSDEGEQGKELEIMSTTPDTDLDVEFSTSESTSNYFTKRISSEEIPDAINLALHNRKKKFDSKHNKVDGYLVTSSLDHNSERRHHNISKLSSLANTLQELSSLIQNFSITLGNQNNSGVFPRDKFSQKEFEESKNVSACRVDNSKSPFNCHSSNLLDGFPPRSENFADKRNTFAHEAEAEFTRNGCQKDCPLEPSSKRQRTLIHGARAKFCCDFCSMGFMKKWKLRAHVLSDHQQNAKFEYVFKCDECKKHFKDKPFLKRHAILQHKVMPKYTLLLKRNRSLGG